MAERKGQRHMVGGGYDDQKVQEPKRKGVRSTGGQLQNSYGGVRYSTGIQSIMS